MSQAAARSAGAGAHDDAFAFVQMLAAEANGGKIAIPGFPDVAMRIRRVLSSDDCDAAQVARVASAEPALAARLLQMANSAAFNASGARIGEVKGAVARIGLANVRTASLAYAMEQVRNAPALATIRPHLNELWERSVEVAALAFVTARSWTRVSPDRALLAGLMHCMGRIYILTRAASQPALFSDAASYQRIVHDWHTPIAKIVLENWEISPDIVNAVEHYQELEREHDGPADITDVLAVAHVLASNVSDPLALEAHLAALSASRRLDLTHATVTLALADSADELGSLQLALGG